MKMRIRNEVDKNVNEMEIQGALMCLIYPPRGIEFPIRTVPTKLLIQTLLIRFKIPIPVNQTH